VPPALLLWFLLRRWVCRAQPLAWKEVALTGGAFLAFMVPQLLSALGDPVGFLGRGSYALRQTPDASIPANLLYSLLIPVYYPARFAVLQSRWFFGDGVSLVYAAVGRTPETLASASLMALGCVAGVVRFLRKKGEGEALVLLLFLLTLLTVGL